MISEATAIKRMRIAIVVCLAAAGIVGYVWTASIHPLFTGEEYSNFRFYPHGLFLPASLVAFFFGASDAVFRRLLFVEAFLICFFAFIIIYGIVAAVIRKDND